MPNSPSLSPHHAPTPDQAILHSLATIDQLISSLDSLDPNSSVPPQVTQLICEHIANLANLSQPHTQLSIPMELLDTLCPSRDIETSGVVQHSNNGVATTKGLNEQLQKSVKIAVNRFKKVQIIMDRNRLIHQEFLRARRFDKE